MRTALGIFVVDDEEDARLVLCRVLEKAQLGRPLAMFGDGEDFLRFWRNEGPRGPSLLLLDLRMPRLDGFDVLVALQKHAAAERLQTIVVSSSDREEDRARAFKLGARDYLVKFPAPDILAEAVRRAMDRCADAMKVVRTDRAMRLQERVAELAETVAYFETQREHLQRRRHGAADRVAVELDQRLEVNARTLVAVRRTLAVTQRELEGATPLNAALIAGSGDSRW